MWEFIETWVDMQSLKVFESPQDGNYVYLAIKIGVIDFGRYYDGWPAVVMGDNLDVHVTIGTYRRGITWDRQMNRIRHHVALYNSMGGLDASIRPNLEHSELMLGHSRSLICHLGGCASHSFLTSIADKASCGGSVVTRGRHGKYVAGMQRRSTFACAWAPVFHMSIYNRRLCSIWR